MIRLGEVSDQPSELRKKFWIEKLALPIQWRELTEEEKKDPKLLLKATDFEALLIDQGVSEILYALSPKKPTEVVEVGYADSLVRQQKENWLRCYLRTALKQLILQKAPQLNTHSTCYIAGHGSIAKMAAVVAIQLGFRRLIFVSGEQNQTVDDLQSLTKLYFDLEVHWLGEAELTLQPNNGSLLLNALTPELGGDFFEDLTYLNFLGKDGLVVDLPLSFKTNALLDEASHLGIRFLPGYEIWGMRDWQFLQNLMGDKLTITAEAYLKEWESLAKSENQT